MASTKKSASEKGAENSNGSPKAKKAATVKLDGPLDLKKFSRSANTFKMMGDPTRLGVISILSNGPQNVGEVCRLLGGQSQPAISHHLALLRHAGVVEPMRQGKNNIYSLTETGEMMAQVLASTN